MDSGRLRSQKFILVIDPEDQLEMQTMMNTKPKGHEWVKSRTGAEVLWRRQKV